MATEPQRIDALNPEKEWVYLKEAVFIYNDQEPKNLTTSSRTFLRWCREEKHGLDCREDNSGMIVVKKDTIPAKMKPIN